MSDTETTPLVHKHGVVTCKKRMVKIVIALTTMIGIGMLLASYFNQGIVRQDFHTPFLGPLKLRMYTNNIRNDNRGNRDKGEKLWEKRKQLVTSSIQYNTFNDGGNIVCLQEVLHNQLDDILYNLNNENKSTDWTYYGVGRTDGETKGEYAPILFKKSEWLQIESKTFWLSETPDTPSVGWDAALERIVTMVTLQSKVDPLVKLNFFNTHFDHRGIKARRESSKLIVDKMEGYNNYPSFLCGDFNTQPTDEPYHILKKLGFKDSRTLIDELHHYGYSSTFTGFDKHNEVNTIIDYIWSPYFSQNGNDQTPISDVPDNNYYNWDFHERYNIKIKNFAILQSWFDFYMSDHRPVSADYEVSFAF